MSLPNPPKSDFADLMNKWGHLLGDDMKNYNNPSSSTKSKETIGPLQRTVYLSLEELYHGKSDYSQFVCRQRLIRPHKTELRSETEPFRLTIQRGWKRGTKLTFANQGKD